MGEREHARQCHGLKPRRQDSCQRSPGKVLLICGPNITDVEARERKVEKVFQSCMFQFLEAIELRFTQVWVHDERRERNDTRICLTLALEWMVESVAGGKV
ncbi:hypothetical protein DFH07DRAFT_784897 [Mycena maculata]|uniref:Uncharacterized protein n=1 Tax=Mycena maculata TaxID=230809 RepID=A0AAD7HEM5_9AGAR|nr:hypothetical protein DFH07DRAFT_784897 [Mycena maculata]